MPDGERFLLRLRALPDAVPPIIRLRHILKSLLRTYRFVAESVDGVPAAEPGKIEHPKSPTPAGGDEERYGHLQ